MSTRRARIKAVTALPPRRKNVDNAEKKKNVAEDTASPKTPKRAAEQSTVVSPKKVVVDSLQTHSNNTGRTQATASPGVKSPRIRKPETPKLCSTISTSNLRQSPALPVRQETSEKRTLFSPPPNLIVRNPNVNKSVEKENVNKVCDENKGKETPKSVEVPDYNVPSVPESLTDEAMDGIIPLKPACSGPKPIDLWKNEIISENAEVLFDPIVPLPSPSKVRPKVRPIPRLVPMRRNSIQGSASESEDESRRLLGGGTPAQARQRHDSQTSHSTTYSAINREVNRVRNDSICSSASQQASHAPPPASPLKEKHISNRRRAEQARRAAALRRRRSPRPEALTMYDLIFYNPTANPIQPDLDELKAKEANAKDEEIQNTADDENNEEVDDPPAGPVPQIKLGPNGEIILDEQSLVINQSNAGRKVSKSVVREGAWSGGGGRYSRSARMAEWSAEETVRFYRALAAVGTDFTLMTPLFPARTRRHLKLKFKKEERLNPTQVDKALRSTGAWDVTRLQEEFKEERDEAIRRAQREKDRLQQWKESEKTARMATAKRSKSLRAIQAAPEHPKRNAVKTLNADDIIERAKQIAHINRKKQKEKKNVTQDTPNSVIVKNTQVVKNTPNVNTTTMNTQQINQPINMTMPDVPTNIEEGSLVVLSVTDPASPSKKMLQTYISRGPGNLTPIALPAHLLSSVVNYMKKGANTPKSVRSTPLIRSNTSSPINSPVARTEPSPKRIRHSSFTITQL